jgi:hypothetical protein
MDISWPTAALRASMAAAVMAAAAALAGCAGGAAPQATGGSSTGGSSTGGSSTGGSVTQQALRVYQQFAQCARTHGEPDFPDPSLQHGTDFGLVFGIGGASAQGQTIKTEVSRVLGPCGAVLHRLPASVLTPPPTAADLRQMRQYAACVRQHGLADFPDPTSAGTFPVSGTPLAAQGTTPQMKSAFRACAQYHWNFDGGGLDRS